jgi:hypothetical protein
MYHVEREQDQWGTTFIIYKTGEGRQATTRSIELAYDLIDMLNERARGKGRTPSAGTPTCPPGSRGST